MRRILAFLVAAAPLVAQQKPTADLIVTNARVYTVDDAHERYVEQPSKHGWIELPCRAHRAHHSGVVAHHVNATEAIDRGLGQRLD